MFDSLFITIILNLGVLELGHIVTSNLLDFEIKFIFSSLSKAPEYREHI
jgi:hypothetical protein